jgi:hypothetical protein
MRDATSDVGKRNFKLKKSNVKMARMLATPGGEALLAALGFEGSETSSTK